MLKKLFVSIAICLSLSACVSLNSVSLTQIPAERGNSITATSNSWNLLGIAFSNDFIDVAIMDLKRQCVGGKVEGILTKHQTTAYFLVFKREVIATGYCRKG
jgi:hypothetical protein